MAVTKKRSRRERRKLPWITAGIGALAAGSVHAQSNLDFRYLYYQESGGRTKVLNPWVNLNQDFGLKGGTLSFLLGYDTITGASPTGGYPSASVDTTTSASGTTSSSNNTNVPMVAYHDTRKSGTMSYARKFGPHLPSIDISYSKENDYLARSAGLSDAWALAQGRGTLHFGLSLSRDVVMPVPFPDKPNPQDEKKQSEAIALGFSWIVGERDLLDVSGSMTKLSGYLTDPYKIVPIGPIGPLGFPVIDPNAPATYETRPDNRTRWAVLFKYGHFLDAADGALKGTFRYYWDDWSIRAYTLDLVYDQHIASNWIVTPELRFYSQGAASFFAYSFVAPQTYMSSDYRLSAFDNILGGLTVARRFPHELTVSLGATYQSQKGRGGVVPIYTPAVPPAFGEGEGGGGSGSTGTPGPVSSADMTTLAMTFGLSWRY